MLRGTASAHEGHETAACLVHLCKKLILSARARFAQTKRNCFMAHPPSLREGVRFIFGPCTYAYFFVLWQPFLVSMS